MRDIEDTKRGGRVVAPDWAIGGSCVCFVWGGLDDRPRPNESDERFSQAMAERKVRLFSLFWWSVSNLDPFLTPTAGC